MTNSLARLIEWLNQLNVMFSGLSNFRLPLSIKIAGMSDRSSDTIKILALEISMRYDR